MGFAPHHPWLVRKGAGLAMMAAGGKDALMVKWKLGSAEEARPALDNFIVLRDRLDNFLETRSLKTLP